MRAIEERSFVVGTRPAMVVGRMTTTRKTAASSTRRGESAGRLDRTPPATALAAFAAFAVLTLSTRAAYADDLTVLTVENGSWPAAVAALQSDVHAEGRALHVYVRDDGNHRLPCGAYTLTLDGVGSDAFVLGQCDTVSRATEVRLLHRSALFAHDDFVPRPLAAGISAVQVRTGGASGGAGNSGGAELTCSVAVRPYLRDLEHGTQVYLTPGRFVLRPLLAGIVADGGPFGWTLRSGPRATMTIDYDVVDTRDQSVVIHDRATLSCSSAPAPAARATMPEQSSGPYSNDDVSAPASPAVAAACRDATDITDLRSIHGSTLYAADLFHGTCAGGTEQPDRVYRLQIRTNGFLRAHLTSDFDGALYLRRSCGGDPSDLVCNDDDGDTRHSAFTHDVRPGTYYVIVDGYGTSASCSGSSRRAGSFTLTTELLANGDAAASAPIGTTDPMSADGDALVELQSGVAVYGSTSGLPDRFHSSCAGGSRSPDQAYELNLDRPARVHLALSGGYDGSIYVRSILHQPTTELACNDDDPDTRHSVIDTTLGAGRYFVIVDGFATGNAGRYELRSDVYGQ